MENFVGNPYKTHLIQLMPGEDLLKGIEEAIRKEHIRNAFIVSGLGTLDACTMHVVTTMTFPVQNEMQYWKDVPIGVSAMNGSVIEGEPHVHMVMSTYTGDKQTYTGHVEYGCRVLCRMEVMIVEFDGLTLKRTFGENGVDTVTLA